MAALTAGQQQGAGRGDTGWSALTEDIKVFGPAAITQEFSKTTQMAGTCWGGVDKMRHILNTSGGSENFAGHVWVW